MTPTTLILAFFAFQFVLAIFIGRLIRAGQQRQCSDGPHPQAPQYAPCRRKTTPTVLASK